MAKSRTRRPARELKTVVAVFLSKRVIEGSLILLMAVALFIGLSLLTYSNYDLVLLSSKHSLVSVANAGGRVGAYVAAVCYGLFGYVSYLLPIGLIVLAWHVLREQRVVASINKPLLALRSSGLICFGLSACGLSSLEIDPGSLASIHGSGGLLGHIIAVFLGRAFNVQGATLLLFSMLLIGVNWLTGLSWIKVLEWIGYGTFWLANHITRSALSAYLWMRNVTLRLAAQFKPPKHAELPRSVKTRTPKLKPKMPSFVPTQEEPKPVKFQTKMTKSASSSESNLPLLGLLDKSHSNHSVPGYTHQELETLSRNVEQHLIDFGIQADVVSVHPGPVITRFELQLAAGVKVSRLTALAKDLARSLSVTSVRIVEIIPGKTVVGIELPNQNRAMVCLEEVLSADVYQQAPSPLTLALGVDIAGYPMVVDLAKMPHLLVAGTTGSGKSVGINAMILSILFKATPEQVRLIMIDPKMLELSVYDGIPHLLTPVVTDMREAASALRWCVAEMERRYKLMAALGVRNIAGYNTKVTEAAAAGSPLLDPLWKQTGNDASEASILQSLPYVVVVIDELADMMMVVGKKVEQLIARIAQKARAAGIHLILATQRPSVDVLTGLIKSNIPTRISFQVSSKIDSRTILDQQGAEQLLGHGDMLFLAPGTGAPLRVHGAFVDDKEVHRIADDWRARGEPQYIDEITQHQGDILEGGFGEEGLASDTEDADPLYDQAVEFVLQTRKASVSAVQRRFKIGYNRAARLVEEMERTGLVGPLDGGFRDILVSSIGED